jgi:pimeloyl-ACP methyl ester carboxylesterase
VPILRVNGVELAYEDRGGGERPFVLLHGFTGFRDDFGEQLPALVELGRTIVYDHRGHGDSTNTGDPASYSFDQLVDDLRAVLDALGVAQCDLLGHSMGGMAALRAALAEPERIASLVLMDTAARAPDGIQREMLELAAHVAREAGMQRLVEIMRDRAPTSTDRTDADRRLEAEWGAGYWEAWRFPNFAAMDPIAYGALGAAILDQTSLVPRLGEIACPTLVLVGEGDSGFLAPAEELARDIPGACLAMIPDAGHQPQLENPRAWLAALRDHLERVRRPS